LGQKIRALFSGNHAAQIKQMTFFHLDGVSRYVYLGFLGLWTIEGSSCWNKGIGGGGGSRTRVRNRCQPGESMLSPVPEISLQALRTDKIRRKLVR